jgi:hypothetical protein
MKDLGANNPFDPECRSVDQRKYGQSGIVGRAVWRHF